MNSIIYLIAVILLSLLAMRRSAKLSAQPRNRKGQWTREGHRETEPVYYGELIIAIKNGNHIYD